MVMNFHRMLEHADLISISILCHFEKISRGPDIIQSVLKSCGKINIIMIVAVIQWKRHIFKN